MNLKYHQGWKQCNQVKAYYSVAARELDLAYEYWKRQMELCGCGEPAEEHKRVTGHLPF